MTVRVGVIGVGMIGQDHIRRLTHVLVRRRRSSRSTDVDPARAEEVADGPAGAARCYATGEELIADADVDAVVVASWGPTHEEYVLAVASRPASRCSARSRWPPPRRPACGSSTPRSRRGRRLVQVGFMRRYDAAYRALKRGRRQRGHRRAADRALRATATRPCRSTTPARWRSPTPRCTRSTSCAGCSARRSWPARCSRRGAAGNGGDLQDPLLHAARDGERRARRRRDLVNIQYGYDIRGEVVGEDGTAALGDASPVPVRRDGHGRRPGAGRLAGAVRPRLRRRAPGVDRRGSPRGGRPSARAPGTATPRRWSPTPPSRRCAPAHGSRSRCADKPDLYAKEVTP